MIIKAGDYQHPAVRDSAREGDGRDAKEGERRRSRFRNCDEAACQLRLSVLSSLLLALGPSRGNQ